MNRYRKKDNKNHSPIRSRRAVRSTEVFTMTSPFRGRAVSSVPDKKHPMQQNDTMRKNRHQNQPAALEAPATHAHKTLKSITVNEMGKCKTEKRTKLLYVVTRKKAVMVFELTKQNMKRLLRWLLKRKRGSDSICSNPSKLGLLGIIPSSDLVPIYPEGRKDFINQESHTRSLRDVDTFTDEVGSVISEITNDVYCLKASESDMATLQRQIRNRTSPSSFSEGLQGSIREHIVDRVRLQSSSGSTVVSCRDGSTIKSLYDSDRAKRDRFDRIYAGHPNKEDCEAFKGSSASADKLKDQILKASSTLTTIPDDNENDGIKMIIDWKDYARDINGANSNQSDEIELSPKCSPVHRRSMDVRLSPDSLPQIQESVEEEEEIEIDVGVEGNLDPQIEIAEGDEEQVVNVAKENSDSTKIKPFESSCIKEIRQIHSDEVMTDDITPSKFPKGARWGVHLSTVSDRPKWIETDLPVTANHCSSSDHHALPQSPLTPKNSTPKSSNIFSPANKGIKGIDENNNRPINVLQQHRNSQNCLDLHSSTTGLTSLIHALSPLSRGSMTGSSNKELNVHRSQSNAMVSKSKYQLKIPMQKKGIVSARANEIQKKLLSKRTINQKEVRRETSGDGVLCPRRSKLTNPLFRKEQERVKISFHSEIHEKENTSNGEEEQSSVSESDDKENFVAPRLQINSSTGIVKPSEMKKPRSPLRPKPQINKKSWRDLAAAYGDSAALNL